MHLELRVELAPHPFYTLADDGSLHCTVPVDGFAWLAGRAVDVPTPEGLERITPQPRATSVRLQGLGFPALASTSAGLAWALGAADNRITRQQVLAVLSPTTLGGIMMLPIAPKIIDAINGDHQALGEYAGALAANSKMQPAEYQAVQEIVSATDGVVVVVGYEPTPFQVLFSSTSFEIANGKGPLSITVTVSGTCLPEMVEEALS